MNDSYVLCSNKTICDTLPFTTVQTFFLINMADFYFNKSTKKTRVSLTTISLYARHEADNPRPF